IATSGPVRETSAPSSFGLYDVPPKPCTLTSISGCALRNAGIVSRNTLSLSGQVQTVISPVPSPSSPAPWEQPVSPPARPAALSPAAPRRRRRVHVEVEAPAIASPFRPFKILGG